MVRRRSSLPVVLVVALLAGCQTTREAYYNAWEGMGYAKRERLVDNVKAAQAEQQDAKKEFANALEEFKSVSKFDGGDLEKAYNKVNAAYTASSEEADAVNKKIAAVKHVAEALFTEWQGEIKEIKGDDALQAQSQQLLDKTKGSYGQMIQRMDAAAASMQPVLQKFKNRVIALKSNLNAQAIASLSNIEVDVGGQIDALIKQMEASITEADKFIADVAPNKKS